MTSILCIGELLIDWFPAESGISLKDADLLVKKAGGAPANVAVIIAALGGRSALASAVGCDPFGAFLKEKVASYGVEPKAIRELPGASTAMAYVARLVGGGRDFVFIHGADHIWSWGALEQSVANEAVIVHFGAATLQLSDSVREAYSLQMQHCYQQGKCVSFDPNYRSDLWRGREALWREWVSECLAWCHLVKMSDEELLLFTGAPQLEEAFAKVKESFEGTLVVTCGSDGAYAWFPDNGTRGMVHVPIQPLEAAVVDTTGAGDAFVGAFLQQLADGSGNGHSQNDVLRNPQQLTALMEHANQVAGWICQQTGAMPDRSVWATRSGR